MWWCVVVWVLLVSSVEAARSPILFAFAFSSLVLAGVTVWFLGRWLSQGVRQLDGVLNHILARLFEGQLASALRSAMRMCSRHSWSVVGDHCVSWSMSRIVGCSC